MLELRGIEAGYGEHTVLRDVSLTVQPGTVVAVLGPNGAGKTTLLRVASGLLRPSAGAVLLGGADITRTRPYARARRGLCHIPEGRGIYLTLTVRENLMLHARQGDEATAPGPGCFGVPGARRQAAPASRAVVRRPAADAVAGPRLPRRSEGGHRGRSLDGLAPVVVDKIFEFLAQIAASGTALLIVEQYVNRALALADQVYLLNKGSVVFSGSARAASATIFFRALPRHRRRRVLTCLAGLCAAGARLSAARAQA